MLDQRDNPLIRDQYERWVYPLPIDDIDAYMAEGKRQGCDPADLFHYYWPRRARGPLSILVAGCGSFQAAILARTNPDCAILGIDVSAASLDRTAALKDRHGLENLSLEQMSLFDVASLGRRFDWIVSTGVLHHLRDPVGGCRALAEVLAPDGALSVMLYGYTFRTGLYMLQRAFRAAGLEQRPADVLIVRRVIEALPAHHAARPYLSACRDLTYDAGVVDMLLNPQDRAYTVDEVFDFVEAVGLEFAGWIDPAAYSPEVCLPPDIVDSLGVRSLDERARAIIVENLTQCLGRHVFTMRPPGSSGAPIDFGGDEWLSYVPHRFPDSPVGAESTEGGERFVIRRGGRTIALASDTEAYLYDAIDGRRSALECVLQATIRNPRDSGAAVLDARSTFRSFHARGVAFFDASTAAVEPARSV